MFPYQNVDWERHDKSGHKKVCQSQGDDEEVGHVLQQPLSGHAEDHQHVAEDHEHAEDQQDQEPVVLAVLGPLVKVRGHVQVVHLAICDWKIRKF